jgi:hypothetical protein
MQDLGTLAMTAPIVDCAGGIVAPAESPPAPSRSIPNVNPATGLSTDYLNHFTEAVMVLEMIGTIPECIDDLKNWQPKTYCEHFAASRFSDRESVIASYRATDPAVREALDRTADTLNAVLAHACGVVLRYHATPEGDGLARRAASWLKPLIVRMAGIINGASGAPANRQDVQAEIDAMFGR